MNRTARALAIFLVSAVTVCRAESLVAVTTETMPQLPTGVVVSRLAALDDRLLALGTASSWLLDAAGENWELRDWKPRGRISAIAAEGNRTFLLLEAANNNLLERIEELHLADEHLSSSVLPPLPVSLIGASGALQQRKLYVAGMNADGALQLFSLNLANDDAVWVAHTPWPGAVDGVISVTGQNSSLLVLVATTSTQGTGLLHWRADTGWSERGSVNGAAVEGTGTAIGHAHVLYLFATGHDRDSAFELRTYHTITGAWATHGTVGSAGPTTGTGWGGGVAWLQESAGRGVGLGFARLESGRQLLHALDWGVLAFYLVAMLGVGLYFYRRDAQNSEADFFLGGRSIPFWAAGISLYASNASSISYIAVPAKAFETNWQYLMSNLIVVLGLIFVAIWVVPLLRRLNLMSVFHYLETRFHPSIRLLSSVLYIVFQLGGRLTIILFLPSLAISTVTGMDVTISILIMGTVTVIYTILGGMKAVIWTDVAQLFVMFGGTFFTIALVIMKLDGGTAEFLSTAIADDKMKLMDWSFNLTEATVWGFLFLVLFDTVLTFPKDQVLMQRVLSTESPAQAGRSVWTFALIVLPASAVFYLIGTSLYVFYKNNPDRMDPSLAIDATFPLFIAAELPIGVTGIIIAGIFAASMSTLSSILNSVATLATVDFYDKLSRGRGQKAGVRFAELATLVSGVIGMGLALLLSRYEIHSLLDLALELWGLLGGGFAGAYTLGMFTRRANWQGVAIGVSISIVVTLVAWMGDMVHPYFYLPLSVCVCIVTGYAASWLFPAPGSLHGLTVYKQDAAANSVAA